MLLSLKWLEETRLHKFQYHPRLNPGGNLLQFYQILSLISSIFFRRTMFRIFTCKDYLKIWHLERASGALQLDILVKHNEVEQLMDLKLSKARIPCNDATHFGNILNVKKKKKWKPGNSLIDLHHQDQE